MGERVLVVGNGGREHALAWALGRSPRVDSLFIAPGNGGTASLGENVALGLSDINGLARFAEDRKIDLTVVGPDEPLALGIVDVFRSRGLKVFGPTRAAAEIETSKSFAKTLMVEDGIPTASFRAFDRYEDARVYLSGHALPVVIKASGLALGKGARVCLTRDTADQALKEIMVDRRYGAAGDTVIIEEFLAGPEVSIHAFSDGRTTLFLPPAQDHKPVGENDTGDNTGGMGTIVPVAWVQPETLQEIDSRIVRPVFEGLVRRGRTFSGLLYPGLKMTESGPQVVEFNARFGDPETQSHVRLLKTDMFDVLEACVDGTLATQTLACHEGFAACVVMASGGYPGPYVKGVPVYGVDDAQKVPGVVVFHAGTTLDRDGQLRTSGGRVLGVTATGSTLRNALECAYEAVGCIRFEGMHYRRDIGARTLAMMI